MESFQIVRAAAVAAALLVVGCARAPCRDASCEAGRLVGLLTRHADALTDRRAAFAAARDGLSLETCPATPDPRDPLCATRSDDARRVELRATLDPGDPRESRYTLGLAVAGPGGPLAPPGLGDPFGHTLSEEPGWLVAGGVLLLRPHAGTLAWLSPVLVGDPLDRLEAEAAPVAPRWGDVRVFLEVQSRFRDDHDPYRRTYQFSPRADDGPREMTTIVATLRPRVGEHEPGEDARVDALTILAIRDRPALEPAWIAAWLRDLHLVGAIPALEAAASQATSPDCARAAKHDNFAVVWSVRRQGPSHLHTVTISRRLHAGQEFAATPFNLCPEARGTFVR